MLRFFFPRSPLQSVAGAEQDEFKRMSVDKSRETRNEKKRRIGGVPKEINGLAAGAAAVAAAVSFFFAIVHRDTGNSEKDSNAVLKDCMRTGELIDPSEDLPPRYPSSCHSHR